MDLSHFVQQFRDVIVTNLKRGLCRQQPKDRVLWHGVKALYTSCTEVSEPMGLITYNGVPVLRDKRERFLSPCSVG